MRVERKIENSERESSENSVRERAARTARERERRRKSREDGRTEEMLRVFICSVASRVGSDRIVLG